MQWGDGIDVFRLLTSQLARQRGLVSLILSNSGGEKGQERGGGGGGRVMNHEVTGR